MRTDKEMNEITVGERKPHNAQVFLQEYTPEWRRLYEQEAAWINRALADRVKLLEHVGSTSVEGLPAKPVIDIVFEVADAADEEAYVPPLEQAGFRLHIREPDWYEHRLFKSSRTDVNLHVFSQGEEETKRMLAFRDRLRSSEDDRERYAADKRRLAAKKWRHIQDYADEKTAVIQSILTGAAR